MWNELIAAILQHVEAPRADLEKNLHALLSEWISRQDLVTRDELDRQQALLAQARQQLSALERRLAHLEQVG